MPKETKQIQPASRPAPGSIAERTVVLLEKRGLSQQQLEQAAGLSKGYISRIVRGAREKLSPELMQKIADGGRVRYEWYALGRGDMDDDDAPAPVFVPTRTQALETAIAYHRHKWSIPTLAAARALAKEPEVADLEPSEWATTLDQLEAALTKIKQSAKRRV